MMLGMIAVPFVLMYIGSKFEMFALNDIPIVTYLFNFFAAWSLVPILALVVQLETELGPVTTMQRTVNAMYGGVVTILVLVTSLMFIGLLIYAIKWLGDLAK